MKPNSAYLELKLAWALHNCRPEELAPEAQVKLKRTAEAQQRLESLILSSPEAAQMVVAESELTARIAAIQQRYPDEASFLADLQALGLDLAALSQQASRDLHLEAVLERIASRATPASETDAEIYYRLHPQAFTQPERRVVRHILLTFANAAEKAAASATLEQIRATAHSEEAFAAQALRHSQCPTALEGGVVGTVTRGKLYPELEAAVFALAAGEVSAITATEMGLHLARCDAIHPSLTMSYAEAKTKILEHLNQQRQASVQKEWIRGLRQVGK